jgi:outer membrane usher protein FimD/PapC
MPTGGGGRKYQLIFSGQKEFAGLKTDTLSYIRNSVDTDDEDRRKQLKTIQLGLTPYFARTADWEKLNITFQKPDSSDKTDDQSKNQKDKWNYWVFRINGNGSLNSSSNSDEKQIQSSFSSNKTTEKAKTNFALSFRYSKARYYDYDDSTGERLLVKEFIQRNKDISASHIISIAPKFSAGLFAGYNEGTFNNSKGNLYLKPALEYSFFPYKDFTTKALTLVYKIGPNFNRYIDTTRFNKKREQLWEQNLSVNWSMTQKWGNVYLGSTWTNYLNHIKKQNFDLFGFTEIRIVKGLSVNMFVNYSFINIQPYISKEEATLLELVYGQRALSSSYEFHMNFGLTYRFGSIYNNIVNPRLNGGGFFFD